MSKSSKHKVMRSKKKRQQGPIGPDKVTQRGPLRASQWDSVVLLENQSSDEQRKDMELHLASTFPETCREIDGLVNRICEIIRAIDPATYLQRAYWHVIDKHLGQGPEESNVGPAQLTARRMLDYGQSLIAAVGAEGGPVITDEQFKELEQLFDQLFVLLNLPYFFGRTAVARQRQDFDENREEFIVAAQMHYCGVRGDRYLSHDFPHLRELLLPQSKIIEEVYGITSEALLDGFNSLLESLTKGISKVFVELDQFRNETLDAFSTDQTPIADDITEFVLPESIDKEKWLSERDDIGGRLFGLNLFEVKRVTNWPDKLVADLSVGPGEDDDFAKPGAQSAWPTRLSKTRFKPFLKAAGVYYCFDVYGLTDNIYRAFQRATLNQRPDLANVWRLTQQQATEAIPFQLLASILRGATVYRPVYYRAPTGKNQVRNWAECDGILIYDRNLFVVEVRSGAYVHTPPEHDADAHFKSLADVLLKPITQANRFIDELSASGALELCDKDHKPLATIRAADFVEITGCCVTLDQLEYYASHIQDFGHLSGDVTKRPLWCVSIDDLRSLPGFVRQPSHLFRLLRRAKTLSIGGPTQNARRTRPFGHVFASQSLCDAR